MKFNDFSLALRIVNDMLSNVPLFALYFSALDKFYDTNNEYIGMYTDVSKNLGNTTKERARKAWLFDLHCREDKIPILPRAIQIEVYCNIGNNMNVAVKISPFVCSYYLMFLCYHELGQYENRNQTLHQLVFAVNSDVHCGSFRHYSYNIAGHCLLMVGEAALARDMFIKSFKFTRNSPWDHRYNSATLYLRHLFQ